MKCCTIAVLVNTSPSQGSDFQMQDKVWLPQALSHIFNVERNKFTQISDFTDTEILAVTTQYRKLYKPDLSHQRSRSVTEFLEVVRKAALSLSLSLLMVFVANPGVAPGPGCQPVSPGLISAQ